jgi:RimJ/RimL family protein N-acetyltransferase
MTEALRLGIRYMFDEMHLHRSRRTTAPQHAERRRAETAGLRVDGCRLPIDAWQDHILTSL